MTNPIRNFCPNYELPKEIYTKNDYLKMYLNPACELLITEELSKGLTLSTNKISNYHKLFIIDNGEKTELTSNFQKSMQQLSVTESKIYSQVKILIKMKNSEATHHENNLSQQCKKTVIKFITKGGSFPGYCCADFFFDTHGIDHDKRFASRISGKWEYQKLEEKSLNTGDGIVIYDKYENWTHYAIYLSQGIYLSVYGKDGPLHAANLDEMKKYSDGVAAYKMVLHDKGNFPIIPIPEGCDIPEGYDIPKGYHRVKMI